MYLGKFAILHLSKINYSKKLISSLKSFIVDERISEKLKLSIVLLNYQGSPVVYRCLESIFNSSYSNYELVFVDNNSDDGSYEESVKLIGHK